MKHTITRLTALLLAPLTVLPADTPVNSGKPLTGGGLVTNQLLEAEGEAGL